MNNPLRSNFAKQAIVNQSALVAEHWPTKSIKNARHYQHEARDEMLPYLEMFRDLPWLQDLELKANGKFIDEGLQYIDFTIDVDATFVIENRELQIRFDKHGIPESDIEELFPEAGEARDKALAARSAINEKIAAWANNYREPADTSYWEYHPETQISREQIADAIACPTIDQWAAFDAIADKTELPVDFSRSPLRWSPVHLQQIDRYLEHGMSPDACDWEGISPLNAAIAHSIFAAVRSLMRAGADLDMTDVSSMNPVSTAAAYGDIFTLRDLVEAGANPNGARFAPAILALTNSQNYLFRQSHLEQLLELGAQTDIVLPTGQRLCDDFSVIDSPDLRRIVIAHHTKNEIQKAFDADEPPKGKAKRRSTMTL